MPLVKGSWSASVDTRIAIVSFVVAFAARIFGQLVVGAFIHPETWEYEVVANNILAGRGYAYDAGGITYFASQSSPLYIVITALVYLATSHSQPAMLLLQDIFGGTTAALAAWAAGRLGSRRVALLTGLLVALDPGLIAYATKLHSLSLDALGFLCVVCATLALPRAAGWHRLAMLGAVIGLAAVTRMSALCLLPIAIVWLVRYRGLRFFSLGTGVAVGVALLVYAPWPIHNSLVLGEFVPGSSESMEWLWRGNNQNATGSSFAEGNRLMLEVAPADFRAQVGGATEAQRFDLYRDAALAFISTHPPQVVGLYVSKIKAFWFGSDSTGLLYPSAWVRMYYAWYLPALTLAVCGGLAALRRTATRAGAVLLIGSMAAISLAQSAFFVEGRHRFAIEPMLLVLSGMGVLVLARWSSERAISRSLLESTHTRTRAWDLVIRAATPVERPHDAALRDA